MNFQFNFPGKHFHCHSSQKFTEMATKKFSKNSTKSSANLVEKDVPCFPPMMFSFLIHLMFVSPFRPFPKTSFPYQFHPLFCLDRHPHFVANAQGKINWQ